MEERAYPRWLHSSAQASVLVRDEEEEKELKDLGGSWFDTLVEVKAAQVAPDQAKIAQVEAQAKKRVRAKGEV